MATKHELMRAIMKNLSHGDLEKLAREVESRRASDAPEVDWTKVRHTCPKCGHEGPVLPDFGVLVKRGVQRKQSWCKSCRATTNYYSSPRKNLAR